MHFCTGLREQKARNLEDNGQVALTTGNNTWDRGLDVVVEGTAVRVTDRETLQRLADAYETKYGSAWHFEAGDGVSGEGEDAVAVYRIEPAKVLAFAKEPHAQTTFRFTGRWRVAPITEGRPRRRRARAIARRTPRRCDRGPRPFDDAGPISTKYWTNRTRSRSDFRAAAAPSASQRFGLSQQPTGRGSIGSRRTVSSRGPGPQFRTRSRVRSLATSVSSPPSP